MNEINTFRDFIHRRFWEIVTPTVNESCNGVQPDGSCKSVFVPDCVDRTVYCKEVTPIPKNSTIQILNQPNQKTLTEMLSSFRVSCPNRNWFFNYSVPANLKSFYYSTNIKNITVTCNVYG